VQGAVTLLAGAVAGFALGALYFGVLWRTLSKLPHVRAPWLLMAVSLVARLAVMLAALYVLGRWGGWLALVGALVGVVAARTLQLRRLGPRAERTGEPP
jgi:F1F0 ATPase subunit 2